MTILPQDTDIQPYILFRDAIESLQCLKKREHREINRRFMNALILKGALILYKIGKKTYFLKSEILQLKEIRERY